MSIKNIEKNAFHMSAPVIVLQVVDNLVLSSLVAEDEYTNQSSNKRGYWHPLKLQGVKTVQLHT